MIEGRDFAAAATIGARSRQEDDWGIYVNPPSVEESAVLLAVIADGMGGMPAGDLASDIAVRTFLESYPAITTRPARQRLGHALAHANREIGIAVETAPERDGMGCTLVAALFFADRCEWLSVGDSFLFHCREDRLERINPLHVYAAELDAQVRSGEISAECARRHPDRAALTSAVQGTVLEAVDQDALPLAAGDIVLLATDGIATLTEQDIVAICKEHANDAKRIAEALVTRIDVAGRERQDNATVIVVRGGETEGKPSRPNQEEPA